MFRQELLRVYTLILVLAFVALALLVSTHSLAVAAWSFPGNPGTVTMKVSGDWPVEPHIAFPGNPGDPQGSYVTLAYFPTNPG